MTRKTQLLSFIVATLMPLCALGDEGVIPQPQGREPALLPFSATAIPLSSKMQDGPAPADVRWFRPTDVQQVFTDSTPTDWPAKGQHSLTLHIVDVPTPLPRRDTMPQRLDVVPIATDWDAAVVVPAEYEIGDAATASLLMSTARLPAPNDSEELPPPEPGQFEWIEGQSSDGVTLGEIEENSEPIPSVDDAGTPAERLLACAPIRPRTVLAARLGGWSVDQRGSPVKVGEYQSLDSSIFFDVDGLYTNGLRTFDFYGSILDNDAPQAGFRFYGPTNSARFDYQGYLRRLDHDPFSDYVDYNQQPAAPLPAPPANFRDMKEDLTVGDDFAIRVQQLNTSFKGRLTDHVNWRLNLWGMRKHGERQAAAIAHCYTAPNATDVNGNPVGGIACHVLSQSQRIDWLTAEIEPVIEGRYGPVTVEYSRTMRTLNTDDQVVTRPYDNFGFSGNQPYAMVPENYTEIDRLKIGVSLPERRDGYARLYSGRTQNEFRDTNRDFRGFDLRLTDRSHDGVTLTGYAKKYVQQGEFPGSLLPFESTANIRQPLNYDRTIAGFDAGWQPYYDELSWRNRLRFNSGYEYRELERENAIYVEQAITGDNSFTKSNAIYFRTSMSWSPALQSYFRYRVSFIDDPLFAVPIRNTTTNTSLPTQTHSLQFGNTWTPSSSFFLHGMLGVTNDWNSSNFATFQEDNYDLVFTAWYAPTLRWTISGGLAFYSNWIDQDITLGSKTDPSTLPWNYGGRSDVINVGTTYAWTKRMTLSSTLDFVRGRDAFEPLAPWPDLWTYSDVNVETTRYMMGMDYQLTEQSSFYFRYQLFDYDDKSDLYDSGTSRMYLFGMNAYF